MHRVSVILLLLALGRFDTRAETKVDFLRDVRPILSGHCFKCHGPDEETRKGGLRLDIRDEALIPAKSGAAAIVPGNAADSELLKRILADDLDDLMPPESAKHPLSDVQKATLKAWILQGAEYKPHWSFEKPVKSALPELQNGSWPRNEIDYFILARLEKEGLHPSVEADRHTLVRRLYLDLIGLPPTPEQADAFVHDNTPGAYERLVDSLLASPHYGERWARRWLDLARYADTNGYEKDRPRSIWPYRDWVINALNADMPFDQFTIEQIAGDLLPNATPGQNVATGFNRNTMINEEGGIDPLEYRFYAMVDRVHVTATTWLGLTMSCAQCHTHKYDPIQHDEYFQFMAFMNNADEPKFEVPDPEITARREAIQAKIKSLESKLPESFPPPPNVQWFSPADLAFSSDSSAEGELLVDGSIRVTGVNPDKDSYTLDFTTASARITHLQLEAFPDDQVGKGGPGRSGHGNFVVTEIRLEAPSGGETKRAKFARAEADFSQDRFPPANAFDGKDNTGWAVAATDNQRQYRRAIFHLAEPLALEPGARVTVRLEQKYGGKHTLGRFRVSVGDDRHHGLNLADLGRKHLESKFNRWITAESRHLVDWKRLRPESATSETPVLTVMEDDSVFASGDFTKNDTYRLKFSGLPAGIRSLRLEVLPDERLPQNGPGTVAYEGPEGDFFLSNLKARSGGREIAIKGAIQSFANGGNTAAKAIDDDLQSGWSIDGGQGRSHNAVFHFAEALSDEDLELDLTCERYYAAGIGRFRVWAATAENAPVSALPEDVYAALNRLNPELAPKDRDKLMAHFVKVAPELAEARKAIEALRNSMPRYPSTLVMQERPPGYTRATYRHHRGEFLQAKEQVQPGIPTFLPELPADSPRNRLGFARWLVSRENPLTARVIMNRHWEAFIGRGLVRTLEDFGFQGELPTHPDLLDWLAVEFMDRHWSQKEMHKLIVMSATYRQAARATPDSIEKDPLNLFLARAPRFRLEAELVRDSALLASGLIAPKLGGPSVYPPQPAGVSTEGAYGALQWRVSEGADRYRRGLYTFAKRTTPYAMTATFDGPSGEACMARRERSNTPLQALTLLNDEVFMETARALGQWAAKQDAAPSEAVVSLFRRCLTRPPSADEVHKLTAFYEAQRTRFSNGELNASELLNISTGEKLDEQAAWTAVSRILLNLDETITRH